MPAADPELAGPMQKPATGVRHLVLAGMTAAVLVAYLPRTAFGPAASLIKDELRLSDLAMGDILGVWALRSEEHTSELQSLRHLVCRLLLEKKKTQKRSRTQ